LGIAATHRNISHVSSLEKPKKFPGILAGGRH
jgi:hypothetical protein